MEPPAAGRAGENIGRLMNDVIQQTAAGKAQGLPAQSQTRADLQGIMIRRDGEGHYARWWMRKAPKPNFVQQLLTATEEPFIPSSKNATPS
jgi:hypothetical protein